MTRVLNNLIGDLEGDLQRQIANRIEALQRHLRFLEESEDPSLAAVRRIGWSGERLEVLCELNAFYQIVLGPLTSSARTARGQLLGVEIPIQYGNELTFNRERAERIRSTMASFMWRMRRLGVQQQILTAPRADDLVRAVLLSAENVGPDEETGYSGDVPF